MTLFEAFTIANQNAEFNSSAALCIDNAVRTMENGYQDGYSESDTWRMLLKSLSYSVGIFDEDYKAVKAEFENRMGTPYHSFRNHSETA